MHQTEAGKMPPNFRTILGAGNAGCRAICVCVLQFGSRDGPADWREIFNHGNRVNWGALPFGKGRRGMTGGVRSNVLDAGGPALEV